MNRRLALGLLALAVWPAALPAQETLWIEAEHLAGIKGYCWPMGKPEMKKTAGHWALSGPGWAAEWTQGGESNFLSIACGADDDQAVATTDLEVPLDGTYHVWVRYRDVREASSRFQVRLEQPGGQPWTATYGEHPVIEEDNELKLYWNWAFAWEGHGAPLKKGKATLALRSAFKEKDCRQIDCLVLTTDANYRPRVKERPLNHAWKLLEQYRKGIPDDLDPLARNPAPVVPPEAWKPRTFKDRGFLYLWNISEMKWAGADPNRVLYPYAVGDAPARAAFEKMYGGKKDVPIFSDPRIVPTFHGTAIAALATDAAKPEEKANAENFVRWLDANPTRQWATLLNYAPDVPLTEAGRANYFKYRDRLVGRISGENLGYFNIDAKKLEEVRTKAKTRREFAEAYGKAALEANAAKWRTVFGKDLDRPYEETIPCLSIDAIAFHPLVYQWGARMSGHESSAITAELLGMRWAFQRGAARQWGGLTATYRSCNFGDASTIFSNTSMYSAPGNILDNYYSVYSGAGMTWYKMDIWYQYMAGASVFYHEQGFDEFWIPGGTSYGLHDLQLSPKGKLVDRFLRVTAQHPERGVPYTPAAFLVDNAHGWDPSDFAPASFGAQWGMMDKTRPGDHEQMLHEYFWTAYHPIGPRSEGPVTGTNEVYVPGVFGDIFDVIYAYPDVTRWTTIASYPVVIVAGDIEMTEAEGKRLNQYVQDGGTVLLADGQLTGAGAAALTLPALGEVREGEGYRWLGGQALAPSQRYRFRPISGGRALATAADGGVLCATFDQGKGRLVFLSAPRGLGIDRQALPVVPRLFAHLTRGLMPVEVHGDVEWLVNRTPSGWLVTLLNSAGQAKPQQGITPTDFHENRSVVVRSREAVSAASDWLFPAEKLAARADGAGSAVELVVPAGGVRILELKTR
jgi:hypothetical protein